MVNVRPDAANAAVVQARHRVLEGMGRRPVWWREGIFIAVGYLLYTVTRNAAPRRIAAARHHASAVYDVERWLHLDIELTLNQLLTAHRALAILASYYYATLHFVVTLAVLVWAYHAHPERYRAARTVLVLTTLTALALFWLYPLAPPRLADLGFVDTVDSVHLWGGAAWNSPDVASVSNEFAAMPSLHFAWAVWSAGVVIWLAKSRVRIVALCYPALTLMVVIATANHFVLDAVAGLAVLLLAVVLTLGPRRTDATREATSEPERRPAATHAPADFTVR